MDHIIYLIELFVLSLMDRGNIIDLIVLFVLSLAVVISAVTLAVFLKKKKSAKKPLSVLAASLVLLTGAAVFIASHSTYYKYNDWWILQNHIVKIEERYGAFDIGNYEEGKRGTAAYYIYTDDGLNHYYFIRYDETGIVYEITDSVPLGELGDSDL